MYADTVMYEFVYHVLYNVCQVQEPKSLEEALQREHAKQWLQQILIITHL